MLGLLRVQLYADTDVNGELPVLPGGKAFPLLMNTFFMHTMTKCVAEEEGEPLSAFKTFCSQYRLDPSVVFFIPINITNYHWFWVGLHFETGSKAKFAVFCPMDSEGAKLEPVTIETTPYRDQIRIIKMYVPVQSGWCGDSLSLKQFVVGAL